MRTSTLLFPTSKETPGDAELISHQLMLRAGMIRKLGSGLYTWLPLGLRVLKKVEAIVREEMDRAGAQEILMPAIQPAELWQETGRWEKMGPTMLTMQDRHGRDFCFGPTHEEVVADIARQTLHSYKQLPTTLYQIQTKFRDEIRPRFGVMRAREFLMKDAYSFHITNEDLEKTYQVLFDTYSQIFTRLQLNFRAVLAATGDIGGSLSHEFHVLADSGEDQIVYSDGSDYAANVELANAGEGDPSPDGKGTLHITRGIEVGHIFQLGTTYSQALNANVLGPDGKQHPLIMGCYGIGVSRIVAAAIEQNHDNNGIIWPTPIAPYDVALVPIGLQKSTRVQAACEALYHKLQEAGFDVLFDDRSERPGVLFADMDLLGIPHRLVIGDRGLDQGMIEYKGRRDSEAQMVKQDQLLDFIRNSICGG